MRVVPPRPTPFATMLSLIALAPAYASGNPRPLIMSYCLVLLVRWRRDLHIACARLRRLAMETCWDICCMRRVGRLGIKRDFFDQRCGQSRRRAIMDEEALNTSVRKFLKKLGVTAQREIEKAVREADEAGQLSASSLPAKAVVTVGGIDLKFEIDGDIELA